MPPSLHPVHADSCGLDDTHTHAGSDAHAACNGATHTSELVACPAFAKALWAVVVYGNRMYDFYRSLAACDLVMPALQHFSIMMIKYGFPDDSRFDGPLSFFDKSKFLTELTFRGALPLQTHLSPIIRSLTLADRVVDLDKLLRCLATAPNLEYLVLLDSVPHMFDPSTRPMVTLNGLKELHWFQGRIYDSVVGTVKLFEQPIGSPLSFFISKSGCQCKATTLVAPTNLDVLYAADTMLMTCVTPESGPRSVRAPTQQCRVMRFYQEQLRRREECKRKAPVSVPHVCGHLWRV